MSQKRKNAPKNSLRNDIRCILSWCLSGIIVCINCGIIIVLSFFCDHKGLEPFLVSFSKQMLWAAGIKVKVHGLEHIDPSRTYLYMFNHTNILDHFVIYGFVPQVMRGIEKQSHFSWPIYGWFLQRIKQIPIHPRGNTQKAIKSLNIAKETMQNGISVAISPEGTRSHDGNLQRFKKGGFHLAVDLSADIIPVILTDMYAFKQRGNWRTYPREIDMHILAPISCKGMEKKNIPTLMQKVRGEFEHILAPSAST